MRRKEKGIKEDTSVSLVSVGEEAMGSSHRIVWVIAVSTVGVVLLQLGTVHVYTRHAAAPPPSHSLVRASGRNSVKMHRGGIVTVRLRCLSQMV